jgi:hypothetical protein
VADAEARHLVVGRLRKPHGLKGECAVFPLTADPELVFAVGRSVVTLLVAATAKSARDTAVVVTPAGARLGRDQALLGLIADREVRKVADRVLTPRRRRRLVITYTHRLLL